MCFSWTKESLDISHMIHPRYFLDVWDKNSKIFLLHIYQRIYKINSSYVQELEKNL